MQRTISINIVSYEEYYIIHFVCTTTGNKNHNIKHIVEAIEIHTLTHIQVNSCDDQVNVANEYIQHTTPIHQNEVWQKEVQRKEEEKKNMSKAQTKTLYVSLYPYRVYVYDMSLMFVCMHVYI